MKKIILLVVLLFMVSACATTQVKTRKPPEGYIIFTDGVSFRWGDELGLDLTSYYSRYGAVEAAWGSYITARKYEGVKGGWRVAGTE